MKFYVRTMSAVSATAGGMDAGTRNRRIDKSVLACRCGSTVWEEDYDNPQNSHIDQRTASGLPTGNYPPASGGAGGNPITNPVTPGPPGPGVIPMPSTQSAARAAAPVRHATRHHLYMSTNRTHKGSKMNQ